MVTWRTLDECNSVRKSEFDCVKLRRIDDVSWIILDAGDI
jgi:hypothetical protein